MRQLPHEPVLRGQRLDRRPGRRAGRHPLAGKGSRSGEKPAVKIDFNKYVESQTFHGYGAVHVKNAVQDASFVREVLEDVKKKFLTERYGEDGGNLFKYEHTEAWDFKSKGDEPVKYRPVPFQAETNETHLDGTGLVTFVKAINELPAATFSRSTSPATSTP